MLRDLDDVQANCLPLATPYAPSVSHKKRGVGAIADIATSSANHALSMSKLVHDFKLERNAGSSRTRWQWRNAMVTVIRLLSVCI